MKSYSRAGGMVSLIPDTDESGHSVLTCTPGDVTLSGRVVAAVRHHGEWQRIGRVSTRDLKR